MEFPASVQWLTLEFDPQCGTAQLEDNLFISIPNKSPHVNSPSTVEPANASNAKFSVNKNATISHSILSATDKDSAPCGFLSGDYLDKQVVVKTLNMNSQWPQTALILPGNRVNFTLETASHYSRDKYANKYGFRCLVVGFENPAAKLYPNSCLSRLESEIAYLGGMCSASLMKKDLVLPGKLYFKWYFVFIRNVYMMVFVGDNATDDLNGIEEVLQTHASLLSKGLAISDSVLTVNQALDTYLPIG